MSSLCNVDSSKFSEPLPWIGLYIAGASFLCSLLMGLDTFLGFHSRKLWFPCRFFSLNATSLTLLSVATKLPVDLNTSMPRAQDQLTKLSGTVLICTVMGNFMTSLGTMDGSEMMANIVALGILVVTVIINIGIQMGTGVIYVFLPEHAVIMFLMFVLLVMLCSTAIMIPPAKNLLKEQYFQKRSSDEELRKFDERLRKHVEKHWMIAHTSSPQYVVGRSATCTASGVFCLFGGLILLQATVRSFIMRSLAFCDSKSDYTWSITLVLISQAIAIGVGTIAPVIRLFNVISFRSPKGKFKVEKYWVQKLVEWKQSPLPFHFSSRGLRKISHFSRNQILNVFMGMQYAVVIVSKLIRLSLSGLSCCCKRLGRSESGSNESLRGHVLHLDGEEDLVQLIMTNGYEDTEHWIRRGKNNTPEYFERLVMESTNSEGFQGVVDFNSTIVALLGTEEPSQNCWALPIVTLTSIAIAIAPPSFGKEVIQLRCGVHESLKYIRLIEEFLDDRGLINMRKAADIFWLDIDTNDRWLGEDLKKLALEKSADRILEELARSMKKYVLGYTKSKEKENDPRDWPAKVLAANLMYKICRTILLRKLGDADRMFTWIQKKIADIVGACLTNLPRVIYMKCICCAMESKEESVRDAAYLLGETEEILIKLEIGSYPNCKEHIDSWISSDMEEQRQLPSSSNNNSSSCIADSLPTTIRDLIDVIIGGLVRSVIIVGMVRLSLSGLSCCRRRLGRKDKGSESGSNESLRGHVLHLDGEEDLVQLIMTNGYEDTEHWIRRGKNNPPKYFKRLLMKFTVLQGFQGVVDFNSTEVALLGPEEPSQNCWALPIVTLTGILSP
ncbi:hypothetical protein CKAN_00674200 [Cinnamomum micranthum f. kanehirae]|uniref:Uncharacterized protein n=1 Tax=Cinnamomum micranthum f. kanehirae TaxID=337451 RepID=A0A3S4NJY4_9MAGN|nr:hypothetical protein CKAN_00674200 [Cinnamomum micranthum f. kanehirae]